MSGFDDLNPDVPGTEDLRNLNISAPSTSPEQQAVNLVVDALDSVSVLCDDDPSISSDLDRIIHQPSATSVPTKESDAGTKAEKSTLKFGFSKDGAYVEKSFSKIESTMPPVINLSNKQNSKFPKLIKCNMVRKVNAGDKTVNGHSATNGEERTLETHLATNGEERDRFDAKSSESSASEGTIGQSIIFALVCDTKRDSEFVDELVDNFLVDRFENLGVQVGDRIGIVKTKKNMLNGEGQLDPIDAIEWCAARVEQKNWPFIFFTRYDLIDDTSCNGFLSKDLDVVIGRSSLEMGVVISTKRLRNRLALLSNVILHHVGHFFELVHCKRKRVMNYSEKRPMKLKGTSFCAKCETRSFETIDNVDDK